MAITDPTAISGGYWLNHRSGVTFSGSNVVGWTGQGTLSPGFTARTGAALLRSANGIYFPGGVKDFLYESAPITKTDDQTIFGVIRPQQSTAANGVVIGRYKTATNERSWQVGFEAGTARASAFHGSNGTGATSTALSPTSTLSHRFYAFVVRKSGTEVKNYWRSVLVSTNTLASSTLFNAPIPTTIGSRNGDASNDGTIPFTGWIRDIGFYNKAISDTELADLIEWLQLQEQVLVKGSSYGASAASYTVPTTLNSGALIAPDGATPAQGTPSTHRYRHHVAVGKKDARLWMSHSSGAINEDSSGQQLHCWYSDDDGDNWTGPIVAIDSPPGGAAAFGGAAYENGARVCFSRCFVNYGGALYVVGAVDKCSPSGDSAALIGQALIARECKDDGTLGTAFRIENTGPGYSGAPSYDGTLGPLIYADANMYGVWGGNGPTAVSEGAAWNGWITLTGETNTYLTEPATCSFDGTTTNLLRLWRCVQAVGSSGHAQTLLLWSSRSWDGGTSWSDPTPTDIANAPSAADLHRASNGKFVLCWNPENISGNIREKLALMIFNNLGQAVAAYKVIDGLGTTPVYAGSFKAGGPAYPGMRIDGSEVHIGFSLFKENIRFITAVIPELQTSLRRQCPQCLGVGVIG